MLKVKLLTEKEWLDSIVVPCKGERVIEAQDYFERCMLDSEYQGESPPFRDAESIQFLKESYDISFINDEDWYSVYFEERRMDISCLYKDIKFALVAIHLSRQGKYTWYSEKISGYCPGNVVRALSNLPFDILVAIRIKDIGLYHWILDGADYMITNYLYNGQKIDIMVKEDASADEYYIEAPRDQERNTESWLYIGKDGKYYTDVADVMYAFQYCWKNDIEGIIKYIEREYPERIRLTEVSETYDTFSFAKALKIDDESVVYLEFVHCRRCMEHSYKEGRISDKEREEWIKSACQGDEYEEYLYFRDTFKIISHMVVAPESTYSRKLPVMVVDKNIDSTYTIHGTLTVKYPSLDECISDVVRERSPERERFMLVVDVDEHLDSVEDIKEAAYGFKLMADSIEIFDKYDAIEMFGKVLKEAYYSGTCTISDDFY